MDGKTDMIAEMPQIKFRRAMELLNCSRSTLYRLMWNGKIQGYKVGSTWRFRLEDLANVPRPSEA